MSRAILIFAFAAFFVILILVGVMTIVQVSHKITTNDDTQVINLHSQRISRGSYTIETLEYSSYDTTSCSSDKLFVKGILDLSFDKKSLPEYCDIFVNEQHAKSLAQIQRKCIEGCDEYGMVYNIGLTFVKNEINLVRVCCDDICQDVELEPLCTE